MIEMEFPVTLIWDDGTTKVVNSKPEYIRTTSCNTVANDLVIDNNGVIYALEPSLENIISLQALSMLKKSFFNKPKNSNCVNHLVKQIQMLSRGC